MRKILGVMTVIAVCGMLTASQAAAQCTSQVRLASAKLSGVLEGDAGTQKVSLAPAQIVNLAMGRNPQDACPANQVLAWAQDCACDTPTRLIVWDTQANSILRTVAIGTRGSDAESSKGGVSVAVVTLQSTGGINGGYLAGSGKFAMVDAASCAAKSSAAVTGLLNVTFTNSEGELKQNLNVLILKGTMSHTGDAIGTVTSN